MARFNTALTSTSISGTATIGSPGAGAFTNLTGTAPYTVTVPNPTLFPGVNQVFYNATSGTITLTTPSGNFNGTGGNGTASMSIFAGNVVSITSDGTHYIVISEDGSALTATTGSFSGNVTMNGSGATVSITPSTLTVTPSGASTIDNVAIGSTTRAAGAFTSLAANAAVTFTANTASSSTTTGTVVVTGGIGASGQVTASAVSATNLTGTLQTAAQPNITSVGNLSTTGLTVNTTAIVSSGTNNVGINTASPKTNGATFGTLTLNGSNGGAIQFTTNDVNIAQIYNDANALFINPASGKTLSLQNNGTTAVSVGAASVAVTGTLTNTTGATFATTSGNLGVGVSSPGTKLDLGSTQGSGITLRYDATTNYRASITPYWNSNTDTRIDFAIAASSGSAPTVYLSVGYAGNVGIGTQIPAYKLHVAGTSGTDDPRITPINSSVAVTATSVFVYDTRKDSDGGAWRKRTQNTSWYNETLNTATRGSRREFPAVAVIVAISGTIGITIYDGDDPLMPMWIKYTYLSWDGPIRGISAVNGIIAGAIGTSLNYSGNGLVLLDFIKDRQSRNYISGYSNLKNGFVHELLSTTRLDTTYLTIGTDTREYTLGNYNVTDVATTVLPNAPIDSATGLPIPTIAVTTYSGIYVIHNNGIVNSINATDLVEYNHWRSVEFTKDYKLIINGTYAGASNNIVHVCDIPYTNFSGAVVNQRITALNSRYYHSDSSIPNLKPMELARTASMDINTFAIGGASNTGFNIIAESPDTASGINSSAMIVYVAPTYNTGWMAGNIKGAWLSDSTVQTLTGSGNVAAWTVPSNWTKQPSISISYSSPTLSITGNGTGSNVYFFLPITVAANTTYTFTITFGTFNSSGFVINTAQYTVGSALVNITGSAGTYTYTFNSGSATTVYLQSYQVSTSPTTITNFDMRLADPDRSVNNRGLQVFGTITKSAIDTGNDLVAYSGWSNSNYFEQPYTSLLDYGTGDFYYTFWIKTDASAVYSSNTYVFERSSVSDVSGRRIEVRASSPSNLQVYSANTTVNATVPITAGEWSKFDWVRRSGTMFIYVNGLFVSSITLASTVSDTSATLVIGNRAYFSPRNSELGTTTKLALFKTSATAPSDVQILKMYNDERELFLPGSKACLYGSSGVITAVAFDNATNLLHVGTSSGRSVFNGLRRVDNTATAVATSISASNGLVAEQ
jgi:hypothetical protein